MLNGKGLPNAVDELVVFQESQTLPLFIVRFKDNPIFNSLKAKPSFGLAKELSQSILMTPGGAVSALSAMPPLPSHPPPPLSAAPSFLALSASSSNLVGDPFTALNRDAFQNLQAEGVIEYMMTQNLSFTDKEQEIVKSQNLDGEFLLELSKEELQKCGFSVGTVAKLLKRIPRE